MSNNEKKWMLNGVATTFVGIAALFFLGALFNAVVVVAKAQRAAQEVWEENVKRWPEISGLNDQIRKMCPL